MIKESVHVDYKKRIITATLPLRGREEEFLAPNRGTALCVLDQQCRRFSNRSEDRALIKTAFNKLFEKGYLVLLKDLSPSIRAKFENKPAQYWIPWRIVHNPRSLSTPVRPVMDASSRTKTRPDGTAGRCLNDLVVKGRIDTLNLLRMILRFSIGRYAVSGDLSKFYNCFRLREDYWNLQSFLFRENLNIDDPVLEGIIVTLMYGVKCVSAQTECAMVRIANHVKNQHPGLAEALIKSRYVDDIADSKATLIEIDDITKSGDEVFEQVGLSCKGWTTTGADPSVDVAGGENYVGVAGQNWFPKIDVVMVVIPPLHFGNIRRGRVDGKIVPFSGSFADLEKYVPGNLTLRQVTSKVASIFDLRGVIAPLHSGSEVLKLEISLGFDKKYFARNHFHFVIFSLF